ncbi:MAG: hypothetical protein WAV28_00025 [Sedimentisphaerales bacterium]
MIDRDNYRLELTGALDTRYVISKVWLKWPSPSLDSALLESAERRPVGTALEAATHSLIILLGGSLKAEGASSPHPARTDFGDGGCGKSHPQAALEAATLRIKSLSTVEDPIKSKLTD